MKIWEGIHKDSKNTLCEKYHDKLKTYKYKCNSTRHKCWQDTFHKIENSLRDPKSFWDKCKKCLEIRTQNSKIEISGNNVKTSLSVKQKMNSKKQLRSSNIISRLIVLSNKMIRTIQ